MNDTTTKHTPGKWFAERKGGRVLARRPGYKPTPEHPVFVIANEVYISAEGEEREANQNLIAAAPDLLERLRELIAEVKEYDLNACDHPAGICNCSMRIVVKQCEAAIKAAEGEL